MFLVDLQIVNMALAHLGTNRVLATLPDGSAEATAAFVHLSLAKEALLASHQWGFATMHLALTAHTVGTDLLAVPDGWDRAYRYPPDCVTPIEIWSGARRPPAESRIPFDVKLAFEPALFFPVPIRVLVTDEKNAVLVYVTNAPILHVPPTYVDALAWVLAARMASPITNDPRKMAMLGQMAERARRIAVAHDSNSRQIDVEPDGSLLSSRL